MSRIWHLCFKHNTILIKSQLCYTQTPWQLLTGWVSLYHIFHCFQAATYRMPYFRRRGTVTSVELPTQLHNSHPSFTWPAKAHLPRSLWQPDWGNFRTQCTEVPQGAHAWQKQVRLKCIKIKVSVSKCIKIIIELLVIFVN